MQSAVSRASSNVVPCVAGDQFDWGGENVLSTDGGVSVYAANNLYVGLPPASTQKTDGGNPILAGSLGYFVESEGVHVVGGDLSHSQGGWNSIGRVSWGSGHPATGTALAVGGNAGAVHSYFAVQGSFDSKNNIWVGTNARIGGSNYRSFNNWNAVVVPNYATPPNQKGRIDANMGATKALGDVNGIDYNNFKDKLQKLSDSLSNTKPTSGVVYDNVNFGTTDIQRGAATESVKWIQGNEGPRSDAGANDNGTYDENGDGISKIWSNVYGGMWVRYTRLKLNEGKVTFTGDGNADNTLQVFTLDMSQVNEAMARNGWSGVYYDFENIPDGASVVVNVTGADSSGNLTVNTGWQFGWNGVDVASAYTDADKVKGFATASQAVMWNFTDTTGTLTVRNGDGWKPFPTAMQNDAKAYPQAADHSDSGATLPGSILAANAGSLQDWVSTNGRLLSGGDLWFSQAYKNGSTGPSAGIGMEHHNFPWNGNAITSCPTVGGVEWSKTDQSGQPLSGSEWTITRDQAGNDVVKTVIDNGDRDMDARPGYLQATGLDSTASGTTYYLHEMKAPNGYEPSTQVYPFTVYPNKIATLPVTGGAVTNIPYTGSAAWNKVSESGSDDLLAGSQWQLTCTSDDCVIDGQPLNREIVDKTAADDDRNEAQWDADSNPGRIRVEKLPYGTYSLKEMKAPDGYQLDGTTYKLIIDSDSTAHPKAPNGNDATNIVNEQKKGSVTWAKRPGDSVNARLPGSEWELNGPCAVDSTGECMAAAYGESGAKTIKVVDNGINDADSNDGEFKVNGLAPGRYTLRETKAPDGYILEDAFYSGVVQQDKTTAITENGSAIANSKGIPVNWRKIEDGTGKSLAGSIWTFTCATGCNADEPFSNGETVEDNGPYDTDTKDGQFTVLVQNVYVPLTGTTNTKTYTLQEKQAPADHQKVDGTWTFTMTASRTGIGIGRISYTYRWNGPDGGIIGSYTSEPSTLSIDIANKRQSGSVEWSKVDGVDGSSLAGSRWLLTPLEPDDSWGVSVDDKEEAVKPENRGSWCSRRDGCAIWDSGDMITVNANSGTVSGGFLVKNLKPGDYKLKEIFSPNGYANTDAEYIVTVKSGETARPVGDGVIGNYPVVQIGWFKTDGDENWLSGSEWLLTPQSSIQGKTITDNMCGNSTLLCNYDGEDLNKVPGAFLVQINADRYPSKDNPLIYELTETKAPDGYVLDDTLHEIRIWYENSKWVWQWDGEERTNNPITIVNHKPGGPAFPSTGGSGTVWIMLSGVLLTGAALGGLRLLEWRPVVATSSLEPRHGRRKGRE